MIQVPNQRRFQPTVWDVIAKLVFYAHLIVCAIVTTVIIVLHPYVATPTLTFIILVIYGYMIVWAAIINILLLCINRVYVSIWMVRIGIKLVISLFPFLSIGAYYKDNWLYEKLLFWFMVYLTAFSVLYIFYQISSYCCCQRTNPDWVYRVSKGQLQDIKSVIVRRRQQFLQNTSA